ncbi:tRNA lysidine(34) synthetase TilS, partial [Paracoccaceae bacterium]|nr:tRNA lysidine(34) synthetase TilS [Paracoccaceae bacterium]
NEVVVGVAVSGGSDSMALLNMALHWKIENNSTLKVASVDHGLRSESTYEVNFVADWCKKHNVVHNILSPESQIKNIRGNLQQNARLVRYKLLQKWAIHNNIKIILLGHTLDDQEENLLARFFRGSGVDGLGSMRDQVLWKKVLWIRPLLEIRKESLRNYLKDKGCDWIEDPSNNDTRYQRVKIRKLLEKLKSEKMLSPNIVNTTSHMSRASEVLKDVAISKCKKLIVFDDLGSIFFSLREFEGLFQETRFRILAGIISWYSGQHFKPRFQQIENLNRKLQNVEVIKGVTLGGVIFKKKMDIVTVFRELNAISVAVPFENETMIWDYRWRIKVRGKLNSSWQIKPFGNLMNVCNGANFKNKIDKDAIVSTPAIVHRNKVIALPVGHYDCNVRFELLKDDDHFYKFF